MSELVNITKYIEWRPEIESEGHYLIYGYFRNEKIVVVKASGIHRLHENKDKVVLKKSLLGAVAIFIKSE